MVFDFSLRPSGQGTSSVEYSSCSPAAWSSIHQTAAPAHNPLTDAYFLEAELRQEIGSKE
jgi:hypothetical protein